MSDTTSLYLAGSLAALLVGIAKGGLGLVGMLGVPIVALVTSPVRAAAILLPVYVLSDLVGLWLYRRDFSRENVQVLVPAACVGIALGWATASRVSADGVSVLVGLIGVAFVLNTWRIRRHPPLPRAAGAVRGSFWGAILGFTSFVSHAGAPPFQIYVMPQRLPKMTYAGTSTVVFAAVNAIKLIPYAALGQLSLDNLHVAAMLAIPALAGTAIGVRLVRIVPQERYYRVVQALLLLVSARLLLRAVGI